MKCNNQVRPLLKNSAGEKTFFFIYISFLRKCQVLAMAGSKNAISLYVCINKHNNYNIYLKFRMIRYVQKVPGNRI